MSGGVGPTAGGDIRLPKEEADHLPHPPAHSERRRFLSFRQLNALAVMIILAGTGMVGATDLAFVVFSFAYLYFLSTTSFPRTTDDDPQIFAGNRILSSYIVAAAVLSLLLPIGYILDGILAGDKEGIKAAVPHVFLVSAQVFLEGVVASRRFSLPMRAFLPIFYNSKRLFTLADWVEHEVGKVEAEHGAPRRLVAGRALALANLAFWSFNLFGFLLPIYLPRCVKRYYGVNNDNIKANVNVKANDSVKSFGSKVKD